MGGRPVCVLRGHGVTVDRARRWSRPSPGRSPSTPSPGWPVAWRRSTATCEPIPPDDLAQLPDLGAGFNDELIWRHHEQRLRHAGLGIDERGGDG